MIKKRINNIFLIILLDWRSRAIASNFQLKPNKAEPLGAKFFGETLI